MKIKIKCSRCKSESLLIAKEIMGLEEAKEVIHNISEVIERHNSHVEALAFSVFEGEEDEKTRNYILDAMRNRTK